MWGFVIFIEGCEPRGELRLFLVLFFVGCFLEWGELPKARGAQPLFNVEIQVNSDWSFCFWKCFGVNRRRREGRSPLFNGIVSEANFLLSALCARFF